MMRKTFTLPPRRCVTLNEAAEYCGMSQQTYANHRQAGRLPGAISGTQRYDLHAIDRAIDRLSGLDNAGETAENLDMTDEDWLERLDGRQN